MDTKRCTRCETEKPLDQSARLRSAADYLERAMKLSRFLILLSASLIGMSVSRPVPAIGPTPTTRPHLVDIEELKLEAEMWKGIMSRLRHPPLPCYAKPPTQLSIRRLHLMRPDLIPYPLFVQSYC